MRRYLYSLLGTLTGIWLSVILGVVLVILLVTSAMSGKDIVIKDNSVLRIELSGVACDRTMPVDRLDAIYGTASRQFPVNDVVSSIRRAKTDSRISGIYLDCQGLSIGLAQAQAIREALADFKDSGKWVVAYSDNYTQAEYFIATEADDLCLNKIGMVDVHGLSATTFYFKDFLDKIGVKAQAVKVGTYKSAVEPFILNDMSEANREQQQHFLGAMWNTVASRIAGSRGVGVDAVNVWADSYSFTRNPQYYVEQQMVDSLLYRHEMEDFISGLTDSDKMSSVDYQDYVSVTSDSPKTGKSVCIAVLYALGDITESADGGISSEVYVPEILDLAGREEIDGLVMRVNSGGGSAFASEQIWEALEEFKRISGKPYYVSMGDMAASGGYYISCGADRIYAEELTLTGSIGIFGIIPDIDGLLSGKLGINTSRVATNESSLPDLFKPMSPGLRDAMQQYVDRGYELFVTRCAEGRGVTYDEIAAVAEGRVWDGASALKHNLVDKLGGLDMALADMTEALKADSYTTVSYPAVMLSVWDAIAEMSTREDMSSMLKERLGQSYMYYDMINRFGSMHPLQCRMDFISVK